MRQVPQSEFVSIIKSIRTNPKYGDPEYILSAYRLYGLQVVPDPFSIEIIIPIKQALLAREGLSVIRIGDGEINLMSYGVYETTPNLDHNVIKSILSMQQDTFEANDLWMIILRDLVMGAVAQADIVGVIGLWRPQGAISAEQFIELLYNDPRGISGQWRALDYMLYLAKQRFFDHKILASAHLYFSLLEHLDQIIPLAQKVILISDRKHIMEKLTRKYPKVNFEFIWIGIPPDSNIAPRNQPDFLRSTFSVLPPDLHGTLGLVGAGPWAEIYCTWIKQRGGVGVDIGTGFDLLDGEVTRPVHKLLGSERVKKYAL